MAKTVKIDLRDHAGVPAGGAGMRRDRVTVWAPTFRPATGGDWTVGPQPVEYFFEDGVVNIPNVDAGPLVVRFDVDQMDGTDTFTVTVPPGDGVVTMRELLADEYEYAPIVISEARRVLREARVLLEQSQDSAASAKSSKGQAASSASAAKSSQSAAASSATAAKSSQSAAAGSASAAAESQGQAASSASAAKSSQSAAASSATAAKSSQSAAASSATAAKQSEGAAASSASTAKAQAGVAETEADRAAQKATEIANTVEGNYSPVGHRHQWSEIDAKPSTFPPATHTHTVSQITNLDNGFAGVSISTSASGNAVVKRDGSGNVVVPTTPSYDTSAASKAYVDAQDLKVETLGEAVDLNTITTTGVYHQSYDRGVADGKNYPHTRAGLLEVFNSTATMTYQRYTLFGEHNRVFTRGLYMGKWSEWKELSMGGHTHTTAQVTGLDTALAGKAAQADLVALQTRLAGTIPYAVMMTGSEGNNPIIVAGKAHQRGTIARIAIPKGVSQVQISTAYKGSTTLVLVDGASQRDVKWWPSGEGGINMVEAITNGAYIYLRAADATTNDTFSLVIIPMSDQN